MDRPAALVTAPLRGPALDELRELSWLPDKVAEAIHASAAGRRRGKVLVDPKAKWREASE